MGRELTQAEVKELITSLVRFGGVITTELDRVAADPSMTKNHPILVLSALDDGPVRPSDVMRLTGLSSGGTTKLLARMEKAGYVQRNRAVNSGDLREVEVRITKEGHQYLHTVFFAIANRHEDLRNIAIDLSRILDV